LEKVVIAEVQGNALAGGCGLATVCDFVFSVPEAKFGYTEVKIGFIPAMVMIFLLRKIGEGHSKELLLSGKLINAAIASDWGIVNRIVDKAILDKEVALFAQQLISSTSAQSLSVTKRMISEVQHMKLEDALEYAARQNAEARGSDDCKKGIAAFLNKQDLKW
jgi:methylglutaconyl-CoA hydratase